MSPTLFLIYINGLLNEIEKCPELGVKFSKNKLSGLLFVDDFVGIAETGRVTTLELSLVVMSLVVMGHGICILNP